MSSSLTIPQQTQSADPVADRLLAAAETIMVQHGLAKASMEAIAREAKASKRTLYARFPSKTALIGAVAERVYADLRRELEALSSDLPLADFLTAFGHCVLTALTEPRMMAFLRLVLSEAMTDPDISRVVLAAGKMPATECLIRRLELAQTANDLNADADRVLMARQFMGLVKEPTFWSAMLGVESLDAEQVVQHAVQIFLNTYEG